MAIALTSASVVGAGIGHATTPSYTVGAASTLVVTSISSAVQPTAVTYGGNTMTLATLHDPTDGTWISLAYLLNPPTGANNFAYTMVSGSLTTCAADYSGVGSADGAAVTSFVSVSSTTTNIVLAAANEWIVIGGLSGHLTNVFQNTSNITVEAQSNSFLTNAIMDTGGGVGGGTVGAVTTINGGTPRQAVILQAFAPTGGGTTITIDFGAPFEFTSQLDQDSFGFLEASASLQRDSAQQSEWTTTFITNPSSSSEYLGSALTNQSSKLESIASFLIRSHDQVEFLLRVNGDSQFFKEVLAATLTNSIVDIESLSAQSLNIAAPLEVKSSLIQIISDESAPIESTSHFNINTILPIEVSSANKLVLSNTNALVESLGNITTNIAYQDEWLASQVSQLSGTGEWLLAVRLNNNILDEWQSALLQNSIINIEFVGSLIADTPVPLEYVGTTKLIVGNAVLPVEFTISISGGQPALDELTQILVSIISIEEEFAGTPITILLSSIGRLARSVKIRLSESTAKVRLLGPKVRSPR